MTQTTAHVTYPPTRGGRLSRIGRDATMWLLRSRLGRPLGGSLTVVGYRGRTSGRRLATPVGYVRDGSRVIILVADPDRKQWWRNVRASGDVTLLLDGREWAGVATVLEPAGSEAALAAYVAAQPRAAKAAAGALVVVVDLADVGV